VEPAARGDVAAQGPERDSKAQCGGATHVRIVCVRGADGAAGHAAPSTTSRTIARFLASASDLECRRCVGTMDLAAYARLGRPERRRSTAPWCLVERVNDDGSGSEIGWVSGRHLAPTGQPAVDCTP
jgi:hypothetical protein